MELAVALAELAMLVAAEAAPVLTSDELQRCLAKAALEDVQALPPADYEQYRASTTYAVGDLVRQEITVAGALVGHEYECTVAGTSGASAPVWPSTGAATVVDGTVTWTEAGLAWTPTYDLHMAAAAAWRLKAAKLATQVDFSADGASFQLSQQRKSCLEMADVYAGKGAAGGMSEILLTPLPITAGAYDLDRQRQREAYARSIGLEWWQLP